MEYCLILLSYWGDVGLMGVLVASVDWGCCKLCVWRESECGRAQEQMRLECAAYRGI